MMISKNNVLQGIISCSRNVMVIFVKKDYRFLWTDAVELIDPLFV